jgi:prepilin-type N-terminal cleavage/methylation domain-containing protein
VRSRINFRAENPIERGFALVELLVVIVILGILAAVVVFAVSGITNRKSSACQIEVRTVNTALQAYSAKSVTNAFPPAGTAASLFAVLQTAGLLQQAAPAATLAFTPTYVDTTGAFTAACP